MTDYDYADMVNPYIRAEEEAHRRGFREGVAAGIFYAICAIIALGMLLVALKADAAPRRVWTYEESFTPIRASSRGASISVCQNIGYERSWACYYRK